jgi:hypothetical protein
MEEDYIDQLYTHLGGDKSGIDKNAFRKDMSTNKEYNKQIFDYMKGESQGISYDAFLKDTFTPVKKKELLGLLWGLRLRVVLWNLQRRVKFQ